MDNRREPPDRRSFNEAQLRGFGNRVDINGHSTNGTMPSNFVPFGRLIQEHYALPRLKNSWMAATCIECTPVQRLVVKAGQENNRTLRIGQRQSNARHAELRADNLARSHPRAEAAAHPERLAVRIPEAIARAFERDGQRRHRSNPARARHGTPRQTPVPRPAAADAGNARPTPGRRAPRRSWQ